MENGTIDWGKLEIDPNSVVAEVKPADTTVAVVEGKNPDSSLQEGFEEVEGKVVKKEVVTPPPAKIEGDKPAENKDGKKEGEEEQKTDEVEETVITQFLKKIDFDLKDEKGNPIEFEESIDGLLQAAELVAERKTEKSIDNLFERYPSALELIKHLDNGGTPENFVKEYVPDFSKIVLNPENKDQLKSVYSQSLSLKGLTPVEIDEMIETAVLKNNLEEKAKNGLADLVKYRDNHLANQRRLEENREKEVNAAKQEVLNNVTNILNTGKLLGVELDKKSSNNLLEALTVVDKEGLRLIDKKEASLSLEQQLLLKYLVLNDFKGVIPQVVKKVQELKDLKSKDKKSVELGNQKEVTDTKKINFSNWEMA